MFCLLALNILTKILLLWGDSHIQPYHHINFCYYLVTLKNSKSDYVIIFENITIYCLKWTLLTL